MSIIAEPKKKRKAVFELMNGSALDLNRLDISPSNPALLSRKMDGIQVITWDLIKGSSNGYEVETTVFTRRFKPVPNDFIRATLALLPRGFQGEILVEHDRHHDGFQAVTSGVMSRDGEPDFQYVIFNYFGDGSKEYCDSPLKNRLKDAQGIIEQLQLHRFVKIVQFEAIETVEGILDRVYQWAEQGEEGGMVTFGNAPYFWGRCNKTNPYLAKVKPFQDAEWIALELKAEVYGQTEAHKASGNAGLKKDQLGRIAFGPGNGFANGFKSACKFSDKMAEYIWRNPDKFIGQEFTVKYLATGSKVAPRHPNVLRPRDEQLYLEMINYAKG